jgi:hypothetical protein
MIIIINVVFCVFGFVIDSLVELLFDIIKTSNPMRR